MWSDEDRERNRRATDPPRESESRRPEDVERDARERKQRRAIDEGQPGSPSLPEGPGTDNRGGA